MIDGEAIDSISVIIRFVMQQGVYPVWRLITSSWILTAFLLMAMIGTLFTWVFPHDDKE